MAFIAERARGKEQSVSEKKTLRERFVHRVPLYIPGFERFTSIGAPEYDAPAVMLWEAALESDAWYASFRRFVQGAMGAGRHLPIYRMSHGEYIAMVGYRERPLKRVRRFVSRLLGKQKAFKSGDPLYGWEQYTNEELAIVRARLPGLLQAIAQDGILAMALYPESPGYAMFIGPALDYLDRHGIDVSARNAYPFYFVYALLLGPDAASVFRGRRVLVVTGPTHEKFEKLERALRRYEVADVQFLPCHPQKSMFDTLDLSRVRRPVDLALVGAGVGAANVLDQLRPLGGVCIDAGYCLTVLGEPNLPRRAYALPDAEFLDHALADVPPHLAERARCSVATGKSE
jgi:hypothetical protein